VGQSCFSKIDHTPEVTVKPFKLDGVLQSEAHEELSKERRKPTTLRLN